MKHSDRYQYRNLKRKLSRLVFSLLTASIMLTTATTAPAQTQQLPIEDYLGLLAPTAYQGWADPTTGDTMFVDVYGKLNTVYNLNLNTTVTGKYTVRNLTDGTQQVSVTLHTRNALCYGVNIDNQLAFGYTRTQVVNQLGPAALGTATVRVEYAPQPIGPFNPYGVQETSIATIKCDGLLRAGSGFAEGTPGFAQTTQTGLFNTGVPAGCPPEQDGNCYPAEKVQFKPRGQK
jgi:hypothetical protein